MIKLKDIGEFGLIKKMAGSVRTGSFVVKGIGDDCAVLKFSSGEYLLATVDMLIEGEHFMRSQPPFYIGRKSLAVSISDIAAMGGYPVACLISVGLPKDLNFEFARKLFLGIKTLAKRYNVNIIGGDTNNSEKIIIDVACLGMVEKDNLVLRGGAKTGDALLVSGSLGGSIYGRHLKFEPRLKEGRFLTENFRINSMIDISDGILQDLGHILSQSRVGAVVYEKRIPKSKDAGSLDEALYMGEDYELLFSCAPKDAEKIVRQGKGKFRVIGEIVDKKNGLTMVRRNGLKEKIAARGFRHF